MRGFKPGKYYVNIPNLSLQENIVIGLSKRERERDQVHQNNYTFLIRYTYIIGHNNPSVRIIDLVSHTTYIVCVNFIHKWWDLQFKVDFERQIF